MEKNSVLITTFYKFVKLDELQLRSIETELKRLNDQIGLRGLMIGGTEGVNTTLSIASQYGSTLKERLRSTFRSLGISMEPLHFKDSFSETHPFHEMKFKVRDEIVSLNRPDIVPRGPHKKLSPSQWNEALRDPDVLIVDTRNEYEYELGHFKNAINPKTEEFNEFPSWVKSGTLAKDKKILLYCTGGIRCEKAIYSLEESGYQNVYQLDGGILGYLEEVSESEFEGECFVFDYRVAVDQNLNPSKQYRLCPHCGQPGKEKLDCIQCGRPTVVCQKCLDVEDKKMAQEHLTCSKNCAHHFRMGHTTTRVHWDSVRTLSAP